LPSYDSGISGATQRPFDAHAMKATRMDLLAELADVTYAEATVAFNGLGNVA
jgi:hypothetical protein